MKKVISIFTAAVLMISAFTFPKLVQHQADLVEAAETTKYTIEDIKNLQDFLLARETPDLKNKDYDLNDDDRWDVFDLCLMKQQYIKQQSQGRTLIAYFSLGHNSGNFETADATTSASIVIDNDVRYGTTEYKNDNKVFASGVDNIVAHANYLYSSTWVAQKNVSGWDYTFVKGNTYHIPYGQPVTSGKYICFGVSVDDYLAAAKASSIFTLLSLITTVQRPNQLIMLLIVPVFFHTVGEFQEPQQQAGLI